MGSLVTDMATPKIKPINYPWFYHWFEEIEAFRIYMNGQGITTWVANIKIATTNHYTNVASISASEKINIYPNPTADFLNFKSFKKGIYSIGSIEGKPLMQANIEIGLNTLDVSHLVSGSYIIRLITDNTCKSAMLVKK